jgi:hypothetical protein
MHGHMNVKFVDRIQGEFKILNLRIRFSLRRIFSFICSDWLLLLEHP